MYLTVNGAGDNPLPARINRFPCCGCSTPTARGNLAVPYRQPAVNFRFFCINDIATYDQIKIAHDSPRLN